jgi:hypothetical protein
MKAVRDRASPCCCDDRRRKPLHSVARAIESTPPLMARPFSFCQQLDAFQEGYREYIPTCGLATPSNHFCGRCDLSTSEVSAVVLRSTCVGPNISLFPFCGYCSMEVVAMCGSRRFWRCEVKSSLHNSQPIHLLDQIGSWLIRLSTSQQLQVIYVSARL